MGLMNRENSAMLAVALSGPAWGIFWIPLRALGEAGIAGAWAVGLFYALPALLLAPVFFTCGGAGSAPAQSPRRSGPVNPLASGRPPVWF